MKKGLSAVILLLMVSVQTEDSRADDLSSGNFMLDACRKVIDQSRDSADAIQVGFCMGFVMGARGSLKMWEDVDDIGGFPDKHQMPLVCIPDEVSNPQMTRVFVKYLEEHPQDLHNPAFILFFLSAADAFPCTSD